MKGDAVLVRRQLNIGQVLNQHVNSAEPHVLDDRNDIGPVTNCEGQGDGSRFSLMLDNRVLGIETSLGCGHVEPSNENHEFCSGDKA